MIASIIFVILAAICNAVMDSIENEHIFDTIFSPSRMNPAFWYKRESWNKSKRFFGWKFDAWHLFKSSMMVFIVAAAVSYERSLILNWYGRIVDFLILSSIWILVFNLFYNKIFARAQKK